MSHPLYSTNTLFYLTVEFDFEASKVHTRENTQRHTLYRGRLRVTSSSLAVNHKPITFSDPFQSFFPRVPRAGPVLAKLPAPKRYDHSIKSPFTSWEALRYCP